MRENEASFPFQEAILQTEFPSRFWDGEAELHASGMTF
jgi:hypothetical protein